MKIKAFTNNDLLVLKKELNKSQNFTTIYLELITEGFYWNNFDIVELINILKLAKQKNISIKLEGNFESADKARLAPYYDEFNIQSNINNVLETYTIIIRDYIVNANAGVYQHEYNRAQKLRFNMRVKVLKDFKANKIDNIFSYDIILDTIAGLINNQHIDLLETLAEDICTILLKHNLVQSINISIEKLDLINGSIGIELNRAK